MNKTAMEKLRIAKNLSQENLIALAHNDILAIIIKAYYNQGRAKEIAARIAKQKIEYYKNAEGIGRIGMAYYETINRPELLEDYYQHAKARIEKLRSLCEPYLSPIDKLRLDLQEVWCHGANIENLEDRKMFVGLCRFLEKEHDIMPHQDILERDVPRVLQDRARELQAQFAANVYLETHQGEGDLEVWDEEPSFAEFKEKCLNYGIPREEIGAAAITIQPEVGDLVIFNCRKLHAVTLSTKPRISLSCFIGYRGEHHPLTYWS